MKKLLLFVIAIIITGITNGQLSGVKTVGTGGDFPNITGNGGLFQNINNSIIVGNLTIKVISDLTEDGTNRLNQWAEEPAGSNFNVKIISDGLAVHTIAGSAVATGSAMININGADHFTIDGSGPGETGKYLLFRNTNSIAANTGATIKFQNGSVNDTIRNCILENNGSSTSQGIVNLNYGINSIVLLNNDFRNATGGTAGSPATALYCNSNNCTLTVSENNFYNWLSYGIYLNLVGNGYEITSNSFYYNLSTPPTSSQYSVYSNSYSNGFSIANNYIGGQEPLCGGSPWILAGAFYGIYVNVGWTNVSTLQNNIIQNITKTSSSVFYGIYCASGYIDIVGNTIGSEIQPNSITTASSTFYGIYTNSSWGSNVLNNMVGNITSSAKSGSPGLYGIYYYTQSSNKISKNKILKIGTSSVNVSPIIRGIFIYSFYTETDIIECSNNVISLDGGASKYPEIYGIYDAYTGITNFYYNSISIYGPINYSSTHAVYLSATSPKMFNNNVLANFRTSAGSGKQSAIYFNNTSDFISDFNELYSVAGPLCYYNADFYDLSAWQSSTGQDAHSISTDPYFNSSTNLTPLPGSAVVEAGIPISGITTDFNNASRSAGYPSIGAFENADNTTGLTIIYIPLSDTSLNGARTLTAYISAPSGVPTSGTGLPSLYWKINSGTWNYVTGTYINGDQYAFSFGEGTLPGDVVYYYLVAQDRSSIPLLSCSPSSGAGNLTSDPPAAGIPPIIANSYRISEEICGTFYVGAGQTYPSLSAAINDLNSKVISCPVTFILTDAVYSSSTESFPIILNPNVGSSAENIVTIKPGSGNNASITGYSTSGLIIINGLDFVIIDGSNSDGTDKSLLIQNLNPDWVTTIGIQNSSGDPTTNLTIRNCHIKSNNPNSGTAIALYADVGVCDNIIIDNNIIDNTAYGLQFTGSYEYPATNGQITNNIIGSDLDENALTNAGIYLGFADNTLIQGNEIMGAPSGNTNSYIMGIYVSSGSTNTKIRKNKIHDWYYTGTDEGGNYGIFHAAEAISATEISSNLIYSIKAEGSGPSQPYNNPYGIYFYEGGNARIYFNTIDLSGNCLSATHNALCADIGISALCSNIEIANNILKNSMQQASGTPVSKTYAVFNEGNPSVFSLLDHNDYYVEGINPNIGYVYGDRSTLSDWQAAIGQDANSLNIDPELDSPTDFHTQKPELNNAGIMITGITTDKSGFARSDPPDIGAYEFTVPITINTLPAASVGQTSASVNGDINTGNETVTMSFNYGFTTDYDNTSFGLPLSVRSLSSTAVSSDLSGLQPNTMYHYRIKGVSTSSPEIKYGADMTFVTLPSPSITGPNDVCEGTPDLIYTTEPGNEGYIWTISGGGTIISGGGTGDNSITIIWNTIGTQNVSVNYNNAAGNPAPMPTVYNVTVHPSSTPLISGPNSLCSASTGNVYTTEAGKSDYMWNVSEGGTITAGGSTTDNSVTISWIEAGTQSVSVNYENNFGCSAVSPAIYYITVNPYPAVAGSISGPEEVCAGSVGIVYSVNDIPDATSYSWTVPPGMTITSGADTKSITVSSSSTIFSGNITVNGVNSCGNGGISPALAVHSVLMPTQHGTISGPKSVCQGTSGVVYSITPVLYAAGYSWSVPPGAAIVSGNNTNSITVDFSGTATNGQVKVYAYNACGNGPNTPALNVSVNPAPTTPVITYDQNKNKLTSNQSSNNQWYLNGIVIPGATSKNYTPLESGAYTDIITKNGCSSSPSISIFVNLVKSSPIVETEEEQEDAKLSIYPNPSSGQFTREITLKKEGILFMQICNDLGKIVYEERFLSPKGTMTSSIDLQQLPAGIYIVHLKGELTNLTRRIAIRK